MRTVFNYFLRGLLFVFPLGATIYIIAAFAEWSNRTLNNLLFEWLNVDIPGLGILTVFLCVSLLGYLFSTALTKPVFHYFERLLTKVPLVKIIYTSFKELTEAFVGDKKRFNQPVIVTFGGTGLKRIGFLTQEGLSSLGLENYVAVYCPHSYNFSGNLYFVPATNIKKLDIESADVMKYAVSGGVTKIQSAGKNKFI